MQAAIYLVSEAGRLDSTIERVEATASDCSVKVAQWIRPDGGTHAHAMLSGTLPNIGDAIRNFEQMGIRFSLNIVGGEYRPEA